MKNITRFRLITYVLAAISVILTARPAPALAKDVHGITPDYLRCEYLVDPEGIGETAPRLSWILQSSGRGQAQSAYRILVADSPQDLDRGVGSLWDSGKIESDETEQIVYRGKPLSSRMRCYWKVMVWDQDGRTSPWSDTASWSMGLINNEWRAQWIGLDRPWQMLGRKAYLPLTVLRSLYLPDGKVYLPCPFLRKSFAVDRPISRATLYVTALGLYEARLNGRRVGQDYFTPGWTDYNQRIYYQTYDVTGLVGSGENVVGAILADGWYAGNVAWNGQRHYGSRPSFRAELHLDYADGTSAIVPTDASWRAQEGPIREADIQAGESYDARLEIPGWDAPGFDDHDWSPVEVTAHVAAPLQSYPGIPVRRGREIRPISVSEPQPGVFVFNLAQNFAGWARLKVKGNAGDKVVMRFAEMLNQDGTIYTKNLRSARAIDTYVLKGGGEEVWEPRFTYHGFQYVELTGYPGAPTLDAVTGVAAYSGLAEVGAFECSHPLVNQLYSNLFWGQRSNYFEVPTDCPQRDERLGWTGDTQVFVRTASYNMDVAPFFTKWLVDLEDAQFPDGRFPSTAPRLTSGAAAGWGDAGIICPWTIWRVYGDTRVIEKHYDAMARWIEFLQQRSPGGLSPALGSYGDWLNVKEPTKIDLISTAYFAQSTRLMAQMARAVGKTDEAQKYDDLYRTIADAFARRYVSGEGKVEGDTQTAYLMALRFGLVPPEQRELAAGRLIGKIEDRGWRLSCGFLGVNLLLPTLTEIGRADVAYRLLTNTEYPSWGYSISQGATTIWERWNSYTKDQGFGSPSMNSFNHYAYGSAGEWMFEAIAGIDTDGPSFKHIIIHPRPGNDVTWAKASYNSIRGKIATAWSIEGDSFILHVTIPANTTAAVFIPAAGKDDVTESGRPADQADSVSFLRMEQGAAVFEVGSGSYAFAASDEGAK
ncbi:MAG TPA: glycoside hydrolase family 78 protein [bacterium]|nr:glycoside hydrolase family 78 protein [bacterium]